MGIKREKTNIDFEYSAREILVYLATEGYFDDLEMPFWAEGASSGELIETLQYLGNAEWLAEATGEDPIVAADAWFSKWVKGTEVMSHEEAAELAASLQGEEE